MSIFELAIGRTLKNEGGLVDDPNDPGGITNFGITLAFLKKNDIHINNDGVIDAQDVRDLTEENAKTIYKTYFWDANGYSNIHSQLIATKIFDMCINMGPAQAHKLAQRACWSLNGMGTPDDDGIFGEKTLKEINRWNEDLLPPLRSEHANFYRLLAAQKHPMSKDLNGWLKRAYQ